MNFNLKNILLNFYFALQIFVVSMGLLCSSFSYAETDPLKAFQNYIKEDIPSDVEEVKNSVVKLRVKKKNGTGFILEDGLLVTNTHAVLNKSDSFANQINSDHLHLSQIKILQDGEFLDVQVTSIQALDMVHDLALLNIKGSEIPPAIKKPKKKLDLTKEELFLVGYPLGKLKAIGQKGPIEIFESKAHTEVHIPVSTKDTHGASGGPIVNQKGELMGVFHTASGNNIIFSNNDLLFSLQNAEYGVQCSKNKPIKDCFQQIEDFHLKEAEKGDAFVQYKLSFYFFMIDFNDKEGRKWLEQAAQQGFVLAQDALGFFLFKKLESYKEALKWFQLAAQQGNTHSAFQLGEMYYHDQAVPQDYKKAFQYFEQAAQKGHIDSVFKLGKMHYHGEGVPQDYKKAFQYFEQAAQKGHIDSVFKLGKMHYHGEGVPQDYKKAFQYFELAAQKRHVDSIFELGKMYYYGQAAPQDFKKAIEYIELAIQKGHREAQDYLKNLMYKNF